MISAAWVSRERASQAEERASAKAPRQEGPTGGGRKEGQGRESERGGGEFCGGGGVAGDSEELALEAGSSYESLPSRYLRV